MFKIVYMFFILIILQIVASAPGDLPDTFYNETDPDSRMIYYIIIHSFLKIGNG